MCIRDRFIMEAKNQNVSVSSMTFNNIGNGTFSSDARARLLQDDGSVFGDFDGGDTNVVGPISFPDSSGDITLTFSSPEVLTPGSPVKYIFIYAVMQGEYSLHPAVYQGQIPLANVTAVIDGTATPVAAEKSGGGSTLDGLELWLVP